MCYGEHTCVFTCIFFSYTPKLPIAKTNIFIVIKLYAQKYYRLFIIDEKEILVKLTKYKPN